MSPAPKANVPRGATANNVPTTAIKEADATTPKKAVLPPHMRARGVSPSKAGDAANEVEDKKSVSDVDHGVWVAAKLPSPYSSD